MARVAICPGATLLLLAVVVVLQLLTASGTRAHDIVPGPANPVLGFDMFPDAANTASSLGTIEPCVQVANVAGTRFDVDVWLDAIPLDENAGGFNIIFFFPAGAMRIVGQGHDFMFGGGVDFSDRVPDEDGRHAVMVVFLEQSDVPIPGGQEGVLGRYTMEVGPGVSDGLYTLVMDKAPGSVAFANSLNYDWWYENGAADIWDGEHSPQYGLVALGSATCPAPSPSVTPAPPGPPPPTPVPVVYCAGVRATIAGTDGPDIIVGTEQRDFIAAGGGDDQISGLGGWDIICGGDGADIIDGGGGFDEIYGEDGNDSIQGASGGDVLDGGEGDDILKGGQAMDELAGGDGNDTLSGQAGDDILIGGNGFDECNGGPGSDGIMDVCELVKSSEYPTSP